MQLTPKLQGTISGGNGAVEVSPDAVTYELGGTATLNGKTYVDRSNVLHIQKTGLTASDTIIVTATSTYVNPSGATTAYTKSVTITIE